MKIHNYFRIIINCSTFDDNLEYEEAFEGPIQDATILVLNSITGVVVNAWGEDIFYLPHGLHIDPFGYVWLTDVALHQVFKVLFYIKPSKFIYL